MQFDELWVILKNSFDDNLYRTYEKQKELLGNPRYNVMTYKSMDNLVGFLTYWDLDEFLFVEHFAVDGEYRGTGIGKKLLADFLELDKLKLLEVEPPHTEYDLRRIKFYEKFGFVLNDYEYYQPPYQHKFSDTKLFIMSTKKLDRDKFLLVKEKLYKIVYNK